MDPRTRWQSTTVAAQWRQRTCQCPAQSLGRAALALALTALVGNLAAATWRLRAEADWLHLHSEGPVSRSWQALGQRLAATPLGLGLLADLRRLQPRGAVATKPNRRRRLIIGAPEWSGPRTDCWRLAIASCGPWHGTISRTESQAACTPPAWLVPIDPAITRWLPADPIAWQAIGVDATRMPIALQRAWQGCIAAMLDQAADSCDWAMHLKGTWAMALAPGLALPQIVIAVPRHPSLDAWLRAGARGSEWQLNWDKDTPSLVLRRFAWPLHLRATATHWLVSTTAPTARPALRLPPNSSWHGAVDSRRLSRLVTGILAAAAPLLGDTSQARRLEATALALAASPPPDLSWTLGRTGAWSATGPDPLVLSGLLARWRDRHAWSWLASGEQAAAAQLQGLVLPAIRAAQQGGHRPWQADPRLLAVLDDRTSGYRLRLDHDAAGWTVYAWPDRWPISGRRCLALVPAGHIYGNDIGDQAPAGASLRDGRPSGNPVVWPVLVEACPTLSIGR